MTTPFVTGKLPVGYVFLPTDEQLVDYYLRIFFLRSICECNDIFQRNIYSSEPETLLNGLQEAYFITPRRRKHEKSLRIDRKAGDGSWKKFGKDELILSSHDDEKVVGRKRTLFYRYNSEKKNSGWVMYEYELAGELVECNSDAFQEFVICRIKKSPQSATVSGSQKRQKPESSLSTTFSTPCIDVSTWNKQSDFSCSGFGSSSNSPAGTPRSAESILRVFDDSTQQMLPPIKTCNRWSSNAHQDEVRIDSIEKVINVGLQTCNEVEAPVPSICNKLKRKMSESSLSANQSFFEESLPKNRCFFEEASRTDQLFFRNNNDHQEEGTLATYSANFGTVNQSVISEIKLTRMPTFSNQFYVSAQINDAAGDGDGVLSSLTTYNSGMNEVEASNYSWKGFNSDVPFVEFPDNNQEQQHVGSKIDSFQVFHSSKIGDEFCDEQQYNGQEMLNIFDLLQQTI